jgi:4-hydroxy-tetrahydrodipicolinate reductase
MMHQTPRQARDGDIMKIAIAGCTGRMGLTLIKAVLARPDLTLVCASEKPGFDTSAVNAQLASHGVSNIEITSDPKTMVAAADAVIDFTQPEATLAVAEAIATKGGIHIIGTTGFSEGQQKKLASYCEKARIVQSGNFSLGIAILQSMVEKAAAALDESYDIEINEMHHKHKKDAPSGTALMLGKAAAKGRNADFEKKKMIDRDGVRKPGDIGFSVLRGGDVVGTHDVMFAGPGETLTFSHQGFDRNIYANGALKAALWAKDKKPGLYSMKDVLGL